MRILYMSCHEILEYDELKLFTDLGHECYSLGAYTQPGGEHHRKRPSIPGLPYDPHFIELALQYDRRKLHPEMLEGIDMVIVMHSIEFLTMSDEAGNEIGNWPLFKDFIARGGRVVWRSIGQSIPSFEEKLRPLRNEGLQVVRYSPREQTIANNVGADALIRFYKDEREFQGWTGAQEQIINFSQSLKTRGDFLGYEIYQQVTRPFKRKVYGPNNADLGPELDGGLLTYDEQKQAYRDNRCYFYHGTYPASYTLTFIEALMTGIPIVSVGPEIGNSKDFAFQRTFEVPDIISTGKNGFVSDDPKKLQEYIRLLMSDAKLAKTISLYARQTAVELFGRETISKQWADFFAGSAK